jgi:L-lactate dehydrogenase complex protein LldE
MRVQLFGTCLVDSLYPEVGEAILQILKKCNVEVVFPPGQTCCGQPAYNAGYHDEAKGAAKHFLSVFTGTDPILIPSGSCATMIKHHYPGLFAHEPELRTAAEKAGARVYELTQFLVHVLKLHERPLRGKGKVTYHSSCHLTRMLGLSEEPQMLLRAMKGLEFIPLPDATRCCGFGGLFMAKLPEVSIAIATEKADSIISTGADIVTGADAGCLMNIADALKRQGSAVKVKHIAELVAEGL